VKSSKMSAMVKSKSKANSTDDDPLLALYGSGSDLWADEHADEYVRRLREGWEEPSALREVPETPPDTTNTK
jgi:hypothetical protein